MSDLNFGLGCDARGRASSIVAYERFGRAQGGSYHTSEFAKFAKSPKRIWIRFWHGHGQDEIQPGELALHGSRIRSSAVKCGWLPEPKAIAGAAACFTPDAFFVARDWKNSARQNWPSHPVSLAELRGGVVASSARRQLVRNAYKFNRQLPLLAHER